MITKERLTKAMSYGQYKTLLEDLLAQGKTTGPNQSAEYINYAKINLQRMHRLEKTVVLIPELKTDLARIKSPYTWLILTEGWCGDASQNLPVFYLVEQACPGIELKLLLRDENPDLMNLYLTDGTKSIPKVICMEKETLKEVFVWGPRPTELQEIVMQLRKDGISSQEKGLLVQKWYNTDKTLSAQKEILNLVHKLY